MAVLGSPPAPLSRYSNGARRQWILEDKPQSFFDWKASEAHQIPTKAEFPAQIILLSGYPTPEWLGVVSAWYEYLSR